MCNDNNNTGKQTPFTVPEGFFESMEARINAAVQQEHRKRQRTVIVRWAMAGAAAIMVAVTTLIVLWPSSPARQGCLMADAVKSDSTELYMSDTALDEWIALAENDEFLNCEYPIETNY